MKRENISFLLEVANSLNSHSMVAELNRLASKSKNGSTPIIIPLVGEFSSGKTSLINALTDSRALETATEPTTATIFEIHFGVPSNHAEVVYEDGRIEKTNDIKSLVNSKLKDAKVVTVYDTSTKVSPYTILVDTPGLSSPDPKHRETLVDFLPAADGIFLVIDINQQLTKSLLDFIKTVKLANKEIFAILTKSDSKSSVDIEIAKSYLAQNSEISLKHIAAVSAQTNNLAELIPILKDVENRKEEIVRKADEKRLDVIASNLNEQITQLLAASSDDKALEEQIRDQKNKLDKTRRQIDRLIRDVDNSLDSLTREESRKFEDQVSSKLSALVNSSSKNYDAEAVSAINMLASAILGDYRQKVMDVIVKETSGKTLENGVSLEGLPGVDLSALSLSGLSYNINLNEAGHEHDNWIKTGVIAVVAVATVAAVVATGGGAAAAGAGMAVDTVVDVADTVSDIGSIVNNQKTASRIENAVKYGKDIANNYAAIEQVDQEGYNGSSAGKGIIGSLAGFIAEKTMSKPQRNRAIRNYLDETLMPQFKTQINAAKQTVLNAVSTSLQEAVSATIEESTKCLTQLKEELKTKKEAALARLEYLRNMQTQLITLNLVDDKNYFFVSYTIDF